jgi:hypothetical protein
MQLETPRDLFNHANLLKCYGRLALILHNRGFGDQLQILSGDHNGERFDIAHTQDGDSYIANVDVTNLSGKSLELYRPLNSRDPWPLVCIYHDDMYDVFDEYGKFTSDFECIFDNR